MPSRVRPPAAAGRFYPADPGVLRATVDRLLAAAPQPARPEDIRPADAWKQPGVELFTFTATAFSEPR